MFAFTLLSLCFSTGCKPSQSNSQTETTPEPPARIKPAPYFATHFQDEAQFVVETIVTDIAEMLYYARYHNLPEENAIVVDARENGGLPNAPSYEVTITLGNLPAVKTRLDVSGPIWSESVYADLTKQVASALKLSSPAAAPVEDLKLLDRLSDDFLAETMAEEDMNISTSLEKDFTNPSLHEQAAALLGAFALREVSGFFYDVRLPLSRTTAHLALARFFAGDHPPSQAGQVAESLLLLGMNNQVSAVKQIDLLNTNQFIIGMWARSLRAIGTRDFRPLDDSSTIPGLEQFAWFTAYSDNNRDVAWDHVGKVVESQPDFCRIVASEGHSVQVGNTMISVWLPMELKEIHAVYKTMHHDELKDENIESALNCEPDRCFDFQKRGEPHVRVIGWGLWALQMQHHLCHCIASTYSQLSRYLGVPDEAYKFAVDSEKTYGGLRFYDFVRRLDCTNEVTYRKAVDAGWEFMVKHPQLTPLQWMNYLCRKPRFTALYLPIDNPHCNEWTCHNTLPGTAYDVAPRLNFPSLTGSGGSDARKVKELFRLAPYDLEICKFIGRSYKTNWTAESASNTFNQLMPYSSVAAMCIADSVAGDPENYLKLMNIAVKWDPSVYETIANYQWDHNLTNEAMLSYDLVEKFNPDAVGVAGLAPKRIKYYLAAGQKQKAKKIADDAGAVYSNRGLYAKGYYLEETGDLQGAYVWYSKIEERYDNPDELLYFCCRHLAGTGDAGLDKMVKARLKKWHDERKKVTLASFTKPPAAGVTVTKPGPLLEKLGVKKDSVIVAIRGVLILNTTQFYFARDMDLSHEMDFIYWDGGSYQQASMTLNAEHHTMMEMENYKPK